MKPALLFVAAAAGADWRRDAPPPLAAALRRRVSVVEVLRHRTPKPCPLEEYEAWVLRECLKMYEGIPAHPMERGLLNTKLRVSGWVNVPVPRRSASGELVL